MFQAQGRLTPFCGAFHNSSCAQTSRWKSLGQRHLETPQDRPDKTGFWMLEDHPLSSSVGLFLEICEYMDTIGASMRPLQHRQ